MPVRERIRELDDIRRDGLIRRVRRTPDCQPERILGSSGSSTL
ncbi:MAG: hypothetical protein RH862_19150 [Leptospiraceae bacterium]